MFNLGPMEIIVLMVVGLLVMGPDRLPQLAKDAARLIRTLREMATGASAQLREELGPEFADVDFRNLDPKTMISRAILGDADTSGLNPASYFRDLLKDEEEAREQGAPPKPISGSPAEAMPAVPTAEPAQISMPAPKPTHHEPTLFDSDAT